MPRLGIVLLIQMQVTSESLRVMVTLFPVVASLHAGVIVCLSDVRKLIDADH